MGRQKTGDQAEAKNKKAWDQIQKQRALKKQQKMRRIIAVVVVFVLFLSLLGVGIWAMVGKNEDTPVAGNGLMTAAELSATSVKDPDKMQGFIVGPDGVGSFKVGAPNIELYVSYSCPACLQVENMLGEDLQKMAEQGKANLILHPVDTHQLPWTFIAGQAVYQVAKEDPEKLLVFHNNLMKFGYQVMFKDEKSIEAQGNGTLMADPEASLAKIKEIATQVGVKSEIVEGFKADINNAIVKTWSNNWVAEAEKQTKNIGTPMFVKNGKIIQLNSWDQKTPIGDFLSQ